MTPAPPLP